MPFALIFLIYVFVEIAGFVLVADMVGLLGVFALILLGILAGGFIIRSIGLASIARLQALAQAGEPVGAELGGLALGFLGGILLILPGFLSDIIGIALLIRPVQMLLWPRYGRQMAQHMPDVTARGRWQSPNAARQPTGPVVIDAQAQPMDEPREPPRPGTRNPWG